MKYIKYVTEPVRKQANPQANQLTDVVNLLAEWSKPAKQLKAPMNQNGNWLKLTARMNPVNFMYDIPSIQSNQVFIYNITS